MRIVEPKVFLIGETRIVEEELKDYLEHIGVPDWTSDAPTELEKLIEVMGRLCYRSFKPGLNPNVSKVREHNADYLKNILDVRHGSVIEHGMTNWILAGVSRVLTHEIVRHRVGLKYDDKELAEAVNSYDAISQESLRFVRLTDLGFWAPTVIKESDEALEIFTNTFAYVELMQKYLSRIYELDKPGVSFGVKKVITSAMRRIVPMGVATNIGWSANIRTLRWCLEARTDPHAEEEIRLVFGKIGEKAKQRYPNLFGDYEVEMVDGYPWFKTKNSKV